MEGPRDDFPTNGGGGEQPADSPADSLNGVEIAQTGPPKTPDRQRPQEQGKSQRERLKYRIEDQFEGRLPGVEPNERLERLTMAVRVVTYALKELREDPAVQAKLTEHGITLKDTAYYMPIIIKESSLRPDLVSASNAMGYFQILVNKQTGESQALTEVERYSGRKFSTAEIYYSGTDITKQYDAAKKNAMAGILYWHICRDVYWKKKDLKISDRDRDRVAATCYNLGPTAFLDLWDTLKPQDFTQFARLIGKELAYTFPENIAIPEDRRPDAYHDDTYNIGYWVHAYETGVLSDSQEIKIGKYTYKAKKLLTTLRYVELIDAMMGNAPTATKKLPEPLKDFAVVGEEEKWMWSIAEQLLTKCADEYAIPYCTAEETTKTQKIQFLIDVLVAYNREIDNPDFEKVEEETEIGRGYRIYFPSKDYIEKAIEQSDKDVPPPEPKPPEVITREGLYTGTNAAEWSRLGREKFPRTSKPTIVTPDGVKPETKSKHGRMPKSSVTSIVLHATEGSADSLYKSLKTHYVVREDGTIQLIRNHDIAIDHAGLMSNSSSYRASWDGDKKPSLHSVGIEVESKSMYTLIKENKLFIEVADPKKVKTIIFKGNKIYYTDKPPTQAAVDSGKKQAKALRAINTKQYEALKSLIQWLGYEFGLQKKDVVTHSMVATSRYGRGRKADPPAVDWAKLGLPDNHHLIDQDVLAGRVKGNLSRIKDERDGTLLTKTDKKIGDYYEVIPVVVDGVTKYSYVPLPNFGAEDDITAGIEAALALRKKP